MPLALIATAYLNPDAIPAPAGGGGVPASSSTSPPRRTNRRSPLVR